MCLNAAPFRTLPEDLVRNVDLLVVNALEAGELLESSVTSLVEARLAVFSFLHQFDAAVVTLGDRGIAVAQMGSGTFEIPAKKVSVNNAHGAGDVFTGTLCAELMGGSSLESAAMIAVSRAADHVAQTG